MKGGVLGMHCAFGMGSTVLLVRSALCLWYGKQCGFGYVMGMNILHFDYVMGMAM